MRQYLPNAGAKLTQYTSLPPLSTELLEALERTYPIKNPKPNATLREIDREAGFQDCIAAIRRLKEKGEKNVSTG